eukprot:Rmarinus@m.22210
MCQENLLFRLKLIYFLGRQVQIVLQNENGPCPLLAVANILVLRNDINISHDKTFISAQELLSMVANFLVEKNPGTSENAQHALSDVLLLLPRLLTGIDVNVKFCGTPESFEFTSELSFFDLMGTRMLHGWLVDPQDKALTTAIGNMSYNQLVEYVIQEKEKIDTSSENTRQREARAVIKAFVGDLLTNITERAVNVARGQETLKGTIERGDQGEENVVREFVADLLAAVAAVEDSSAAARDDRRSPSPASPHPAIDLTTSLQDRTQASHVPESAPAQAVEHAFASPDPLGVLGSLGSSSAAPGEGTPSSQPPHPETSFVDPLGALGPRAVSQPASQPDGDTSTPTQAAQAHQHGSPNIDASTPPTGAGARKTAGSVGAGRAATAGSVPSEQQNGGSDAASLAAAHLALITDFLKSTGSQLTYCGLYALHNTVKERELCVFFRNNHFNTLFKFNGSLYILLTDLGYAEEDFVVWEKLCEVDGDNVFVTDDFGPVPSPDEQARIRYSRLQEAQRNMMQPNSAGLGGFGTSSESPYHVPAQPPAEHLLPHSDSTMPYNSNLPYGDNVSYNGNNARAQPCGYGYGSYAALPPVGYTTAAPTDPLQAGAHFPPGALGHTPASAGYPQTVAGSQPPPARRLPFVFPWRRRQQLGCGRSKWAATVAVASCCPARGARRGAAPRPACRRAPSTRRAHAEDVRCAGTARC